MLTILTNRAVGYGIAVLAVLAALWFAYSHIEGKGYDRGVAEWSLKYDRLVSDYQTARTVELERIAKANEVAKANEARRIAKLEKQAEDLETKIKELANEADKDPDRDQPAIGADGVQRINRIR